MRIFRVIIEIAGIIAALPSALLIPALIITGIMGAVKKDYTYLKKYLKIWAYSLIAFVVVLFIYGLGTYIAASMAGGV
ncbi:MAG: hypothetical protein AAB766_01955 [Patescibacteria group bacterium]